MKKKYNLLIIEDNTEDQTMYHRYLSKASENSIEVSTQETGLNALDYMLKNPVDCILLDYQLPDMSGIEFLQKIQDTKYPKIPVIMLTGQGNEKIAVDALKLGAYDYLIKSDLQATQLYQTVLNAIEKCELKNKLEQQMIQNEFLAYHDPLTGLANRRQFEVLAEHALLRSQRFNQIFAIFMMDLDGFKQVNDSKGHAAGDEVLKEAARRFTVCLRKNDILGRMGGDEFCIVFEDLHSREGATVLSEKLIQCLDEPIALKEGAATVSVSIGIALYPETGKTVPLLMKKADAALYAAKEGGKKTFRFA